MNQDSKSGSSLEHFRLAECFSPRWGCRMQESFCLQFNQFKGWIKQSKQRTMYGNSLRGVAFQNAVFGLGIFHDPCSMLSSSEGLYVGHFWVEVSKWVQMFWHALRVIPSAFSGAETAQTAPFGFKNLDDMMMWCRKPHQNRRPFFFSIPKNPQNFKGVRQGKVGTPYEIWMHQMHRNVMNFPGFLL